MESQKVDLVKGETRMICPMCAGSGISNICVNGHFKTCEYCNGTGEVFQCPKCGEITQMNNIGSLFDHDYAWYKIECPKCGYFSDGGTDPQKAIDMFVKGMGDIPKPLTEQEYIQTCSTEQLAKWLSKISKFFHECGKRDVYPKTMYEEDWEWWLKEIHHADRS